MSSGAARPLDASHRARDDDRCATHTRTAAHGWALDATAKPRRAAEATGSSATKLPTSARRATSGPDMTQGASRHVGIVAKKVKIDNQTTSSAQARSKFRQTSSVGVAS